VIGSLGDWVVGNPITQRPNDPTTQESFRLRIYNTALGGVEISTDGGTTWLLVGRVARPAMQSAPGAKTELPTVERVSRDGLAFAVGDGRLVRLLPDTPANRRDKAAILVNVPAAATLFKDLLPPPESPVQQIMDRRPAPLPRGYVPQDYDTLLITVKRSDIPSDKLAAYALDAATHYREAALARLHAKGRKGTSGFLTVSATIPPDIQPGAVTFSLDGAVLVITNHGPYSVRWDTRSWTDGEHLIEVCARDTGGGVITRTKALVVVDNRP
jgi:hypothetical protein